MTSIGNRLINSIYEANIKNYPKPKPTTNSSRLVFIFYLNHHKYFYKKSPNLVHEHLKLLKLLKLRKTFFLNLI